VTEFDDMIDVHVDVGQAIERAATPRSRPRPRERHTFVFSLGCSHDAPTERAVPVALDADEPEPPTVRSAGLTRSPTISAEEALELLPSSLLEELAEELAEELSQAQVAT
jgi:hypothetical protein